MIQIGGSYRTFIGGLASYFLAGTVLYVSYLAFDSFLISVGLAVVTWFSVALTGVSLTAHLELPVAMTSSWEQLVKRFGADNPRMKVGEADVGGFGSLSGHELQFRLRAQKRNLHLYLVYPALLRHKYLMIPWEAIESLSVAPPDEGIQRVRMNVKDFEKCRLIIPWCERLSEVGSIEVEEPLKSVS